MLDFIFENLSLHSLPTDSVSYTNIMFSFVVSRSVPGSPTLQIYTKLGSKDDDNFLLYLLTAGLSIMLGKTIYIQKYSFPLIITIILLCSSKSILKQQKTTASWSIKYYYFTIINLLPFSLYHSKIHYWSVNNVLSKNTLWNSLPATLTLCQHFICFSFDTYSFKTSKKKKKSEKFNSYISHCVVKSFVKYPMCLRGCPFLFRSNYTMSRQPDLSVWSTLYQFGDSLYRLITRKSLK